MADEQKNKTEEQPSAGKNKRQERRSAREPGVPAEDMEFNEGDDNSVSTKVGTAGWPEGAENDPNVGPTGEKLDEKGNASGETTAQPQPEPTPPPAEQPAQPTPPAPPPSNP